jgi:cobalamin biosynthesis Mg chelatase CobN
MRDSLAVSRNLQAAIGQTIRLRQYTFSPPDSTGRQYVESATLLTSVTDKTYTEQAAGERKQTTSLTETHAEQSAEHTETAPHTRRFPYWMVGVVVVVVVVVGIIYASRKSSR